VTHSASLDAGLRVFCAELERWGARMNLVGSTAPADVARHVEDSLAAVELLPQGAVVVDLGTGAGFPGLPIAIARPDLKITLVEIRDKRLAFLRHAVRELGLSVEVRAASIEAAPPDASFDFALLRAVAKPERSLELGLPWVKPTGEVWIWAGPEAHVPQTHPVPLASGGRILRARAADFSRGTA
jgi:16S rRNA (guanine527-N7)-methyltransferase